MVASSSATQAVINPSLFVWIKIKVVLVDQLGHASDELLHTADQDRMARHPAKVYSLVDRLVQFAQRRFSHLLFQKVGFLCLVLIFIRASLVVNCQLTLAFLVFLAFCQASTSFFTSEMLLIHRFKHCPLKTFNSISAMFNQLPCFGVYTNSNRFQRALAFSGGNVSYRAPGPWVFRLSITNVMSCAFLYSLAIVSRN